MTERKLCMGCMSEKAGEGVCDKCGYSDKTPYLPSYLAPGTLLNDRYIAGKLMSYNGESATYIGYDTATDTKVTIKEYMPDTLCSRQKDEKVITVDPSQMPLYKTYMSEFLELNKALHKSRGMTHIQTVLDIFQENNTAYVVFEYINGITLKAYLSNCSGELSWDRVKELFPPILTTLSLVHSAGIIHRGISPQTIIVTDKQELKLIDFQISAGRTTNTELACEMFPGYSAPEQYSSNEWQGTWTDVYGISATLYRILTGTAPTESIARLGTDNCPEPMMINRNVPSHVSKVIMNGLKLNTQARIQTITDLVVKLFEQPKFNNTAQTEPIKPVAAAASEKGNQPRTVLVKKADGTLVKQTVITETIGTKKKKKDNKAAIIAGIIAFGVLIIGFVIAIILMAGSTGGNAQSNDPNPYIPPESSSEVTTTTTTTTETEPPAPSSSEPDVVYVCPNFDRYVFAAVQDNAKYNYLKITAVHEFNDEYPVGIIFKQSVKEGKEIAEGTEIKLTVSKGPSKVELPDFKNKTVEEYTAMLSAKNIKFEKKAMKSDSVKPGYVVKCSKKVGEKVDVEKDEKVTVYYVKKESDSTSSNTSSTSSRN